MISDFVKGRAQYNYPPNIQKGITLHRHIDQFTDCHPATKKAKEYFRPFYRLYSGALVDVVYDHFLATDADIFPGESLLPFTQKTYQILESFSPHLPLRFVQVFAYMRTENWLWQYRLQNGIEKSLHGLVRRSAYISDSQTACTLLQQHYTALQECYKVFIEDVKQYAKEQLHQLIE